MPQKSPAVVLMVLTMLTAAMIVLSPIQAQAQLKVLWSFSGGLEGATPNALAIATDGSIYGTAASGGAHNMGVVFQLTSTSTGWSENILYNFTGGRDGSSPNALVFGPDGNLYGTAKNGGNVNCPSGCGTVFQLKSTSSGWTFNVLHTFMGRSDGHDPAGVILDNFGDLFGATLYGGPSNVGVVYQLTMSSGSNWPENIVYAFSGGKDGSYPNPQLAVDASGNIFGTTQFGGVAPGLQGFGEAFELYFTFYGWQRTMMASFIGNGANQPGSYPLFGVISDGDGNLYGVTSGGDGDFGNVYRMEPNPLGGRWQFKVLHDFSTNTNGSSPTSLVRDSAGNLYGAALTGGSGSCPSGCGTLFSLQEEASGAWPLTLLYTFTGGSDTNGPSNLIIDSAGNLYGTAGNATTGVVFELPASLK